ncbi:MAG: glycerol-3-phosphate acyltransferase [Candidatus Hydrogenedentota bacterium]
MPPMPLNDVALTVVAVLLSYILGSVPTGLWLGLRVRGVDIREHGSKNIGATNTLRVLGKGLGAAALVGDAAKGVVPVLLISRISPWDHAALACGVAAIAGHLASVFLKFKGGKGVATSLGVFITLCPIPTAVAAVTFALVLGVTRMVSAGSISAAVAMTLAVFVLSHDLATAPGHLLPPGPALKIMVAAIALLVIVKHRTNIQRILQGKESRLF